MSLAIPFVVPFASGRAVPSHLDRAVKATTRGGDCDATARSVSSRHRIGSRRLARLDGGLSARDRAILRSVWELRLLSAAQIQRLHFAASEEGGSALTRARVCRRVLERLVGCGLLARLERRVGGIRAGSASHVYAATTAGIRLLDPASPRRRPYEPSAAFVAHTLAVADAYIAIVEAEREGQLEILALEAEPRCWRVFADLGGGRQVVRPDLFVSVGVGELEHRWFVEVDMGTEHMPAIRRKLDAYLAYYHSGAEQVAHDIFPKVLWVASGQRLAVRLGETIGRANEATALFAVTTSDGFAAAVAGGQA